MTALPLPPRPQSLLTVADYVALGEDPDGVRYELQEGILVMAASPFPRHQRCILRFGGQLEPQLPDHLDVFPDVDIDLQLVPPTGPGTVRRPDLAVVTRDGFERREREGGVLRASELVVAIEVLSPGSVRVDRVLKNSEYADAGVPYYWLVDLGEKGDRPQLTAFHLGGECGYVGAGAVIGTFTTTEPFPVCIDLDALV
jgi:Uma2 family endonuclease